MADRHNLTASGRIVSGGQSGADRAALDWAIAHSFNCGGWCPKGRRYEDGPIPLQYVLSETPLANYLQRTEWNVRDGDATIIFTLTHALDGGSKRTAQFADKLHRPWLHFRPGVHEKYLVQFLGRHKVAVLNVAGRSPGPRGSKGVSFAPRAWRPAAGARLARTLGHIHTQVLDRTTLNDSRFHLLCS